MLSYPKRYRRYIFMEGAMTTRKGTKTSMRRQRTEKQKLDNIYKEVEKYAKDRKVADQLIAKYGVNCAYTIVRQCMQEPGNVIHRMVPHARWLNTGDAMKFFVGAKLTDEAVAKGINKTLDFVKNSKQGKNTSSQAKTSQTKVATKTKQRTVAKTKSKVAAQTPKTVPITPRNNPLTSNPFFNNIEQQNPYELELWTRPMIKTYEQYVPETLTIDQQVDFEFRRLKKENPNGVTLSALYEDGFVIDSRHISENDIKYLHAGKDGKGIGAAVQAATVEIRNTWSKEKQKDSCSAATRLGQTDYMNKTYNLGISRNPDLFYRRYTNARDAAKYQYQFNEYYSEYFTVLNYKNNGKDNGAVLDNVPDGTTVYFDRNPRTKKSHGATYYQGKWYAGYYSQDKEKISRGRYTSYGTDYNIAIANDTTVDDVLLKKMIRQRIEENERIKARTKQPQIRSGGR